MTESVRRATEGGGTDGASERVLEAWEQFVRTSAALLREVNGAIEHRGGLSPSEYDVLLQLVRARGTPMRPAALKEQLLLSQPALSRLLGRMHGDGLIERVSDDRDGRAQLISLAPAGRRAFRRAAAVAAETVQEVFGSPLEPSQLEQLTTLLERLRDGTRR